MESKTTSNRIHPLVAAAAVSVMLVSLVGVAAITGILPNSNGTVAPMTSTTTNFASSSPSALLAANSAPVSNMITEPADVQNQPPKPVHKPLPKATPSSSSNQNYSQRNAAPLVTAQAHQTCHQCGRIESITAIHQQARPSGVGVAAGAVLGGILGNQVGNGNGRTLATVAGAVGGGYAGNEVEKRTHTATSYQVRVRMEDGTTRSFPQSGQNGWQVGDRVRVVNGALTSEG